MGRKCSVVGCQSTVGLHYFPQDLDFRRQWYRVIGLGDSCELPPHAGVCNHHFARDSFDNLIQFELGFTTKLRLKSEAVPTLGLPRARKELPTLLPSHGDSGRHSEPKATREMACQTDPIISRHACVQANVKPSRRSKGLQVQAPHKSVSVSCDTGTFMGIPLPESPLAASTPLKRKKCEVSASDPSFHLNDSSLNCSSATTEVPPHKARKYIVHEDQLLSLFQKCPVCTRRCTVETTTLGTLLRVKQQCPACEYFNDWSSQPMVKDIPAGNLQLCAAVLFTGSCFGQISKFLRAFNIQGLSEQTFYKHQAKLLIPTVSWQWKLEQDEKIREAATGGPLTLGGDMRADSPGHSAKYGSYTMMNLQSNSVIDIQLIQSSEVGNSVRMEKEGFIRSLTMLEEKGVKVQAIVTDRHTGVQKYLREEKKDITHYFDPWHMGKGMGKKIDGLAKKKITQDVGQWRKSVVNHLYWSASTSSSGEEAVAKWTSVANHIQNIHAHDNALFPCCQHEPLVGERAREWLKPSTAACERLTAILLAPRFLKDVEKISPLYHTSYIEAFHSLIIRFSPKSVCFSFKGMMARLQISALHYNENATRTHARTAAGELRYSIVYPKYKHGDYTVRALKTKFTTFYIDKLMTLLFECVVQDTVPYQEHSDKIHVPEPLCGQYERPDKKEAVSRHRSRFFKSK